MASRSIAFLRGGIAGGCERGNQELERAGICAGSRVCVEDTDLSKFCRFPVAVFVLSTFSL